MDFRYQVSEWFKELQVEICRQLEECDGFGKFNFESWERSEGGGGNSASLLEGMLIEKGGVNFSAVEGVLPKTLEKAFGIVNTHFFATGVSIVMHPINPWIPIIHMNIRYFEMDGGRCWFGGGIDLTPHYIVAEDACFFHKEVKGVCDEFNETFYPRFKKWADDYFFIPHRNETRGVGGIFFDRLEPDEETSVVQYFDFVKRVGKSFFPIYAYFLNKNRAKSYTEVEKHWQLIRRGRYAEFNLIYDAGTKFGLETNGRIESILMSLPPLASWPVDYNLRQGGPEEFTKKNLVKGVNWIGN